MRRALAVVAFLAVFPFTRSGAQCSDADKAALEAFDKAWGDAGQKGDRAFLDGVYAASYVAHNLSGPADKATTIANTITAFEQNKANPQPAAVPDHYMISCTPTTATITHRNTIPAAAGSTSGATYSRSIHFLEKRGNRWQVVSSTGQPLNDGALLSYMEVDWNDATKRKDVAWFERNYASFSSDVDNRTGALDSKAQTLESIRTGKIAYESLALSDLNVRVEGDVAVVTGINHVKGRDEQGKPFDRRVRFTDTFIKRDGRWQVWATQGTPIT
jgi:ketosteroid isomerase-like protein